ncbi:uncharacterized protein N0V96_002768 [Colletotrichum fioriniae]|uniref:uncharacterized protein n=1 Tax=Colletotrichum fioriniae TaxID=710243 RepID=UPI0032DB1AAC|nr:hypothetical protein N0V96_002768 [Colletotrichum fioriniae]
MPMAQFKIKILATGLGLLTPLVHAVAQAPTAYSYAYSACGKITNFNAIFYNYYSYSYGNVQDCQNDFYHHIINLHQHVENINVNILDKNHDHHNDQQQLHKVYDYFNNHNVLFTDFDVYHHKCRTN